MIDVQAIIEIVSKYGFPIVATIGLCALVYYIWTWVTKVIGPLISEIDATLITLIDDIRTLDQDLIRLDQKTNTTVQLRDRKIVREIAEDQANNV